MLDRAGLVERVKAYDPNADVALLERAYDYAERAHAEQVRASGEPYFTHPRAVAEILADLRLDDATIATALLHDTIEDTGTTRAEIDRLFGPEVGMLVDGVTKIKKLDLVTKKAEQAEQFRKLLLAISADVRVLLVKLADRLHNMRTLQYVRREKQKRIAQETMDIYAPLAGRMGMQWLREELETLSFKWLNPRAFAAVVAKLEAFRKENRAFIEQIERDLMDKLAEKNISASVSARQKQPCSIWRKMEDKKLSFEKVSDIYGFRIITDTVEDCYRVLGIVHTTWRMVPGQFKDYISTPKRNDYQSIHTTVVGSDHQRVELQIRDRRMHEIAEYGIAAHTLYKDGLNAEGVRRRRLSQESNAYRWLQTLVSTLLQGDNPEEFLEHTKLELFQDQVFCFTPKGRLIALPRGATPIDFAYAVHTDVGNTFVGCKINGRIMPRKTELRNGDEVEILTSQGQRPNPAWEKIAVTGKAKSAIRRATKEARRKQFAELGRQFLKAAHTRFGKTYDEQVIVDGLHRLSQKTLDDVLVDIGRGELETDTVMYAAYPGLKTEKPRRRRTEARSRTEEGWFGLKKIGWLKFRLPSWSTPEGAQADPKSGIPIRGVDADLPVRFAEGGGAVPGDRIVGILTPGEGITIYEISSDELRAYDDQPERWIDVTWDIDENSTARFPTQIQVTAVNAPGSLAQIAQVIGEHDGNIDKLQMLSRAADFTDMLIDLEVLDLKHLEELISELKRLPVVNAVQRVRRPPSAARSQGDEETAT